MRCFDPKLNFFWSRVREINGIRSKIGSHSFSCVWPLGQPHSAIQWKFPEAVSEEGSEAESTGFEIYDVAPQHRRSSEHWFSFSLLARTWFSHDNADICSSPCELEIHYSRSGAIRQRSHRLFRLLDKAKQSAKHLRIAVGFGRQAQDQELYLNLDAVLEAKPSFLRAERNRTQYL